MPNKVLAYQCKFCGALKRSFGICQRHEYSCLQNPNARNCLLCEHMVVENREARCSVKNKKCTSAVSGHCDSFVRMEGHKHGKDT